MLKKERHALIMREVNIRNKVLHADLSKKLAVSEDTIRRDLQELAEEGKLVKVRGGALSKSFQTNSYRGGDIYKYQEKTAIARKAVPLFSNGMLVLISGGTTTVELARILPPELEVTFYTPSLLVALQLAEHPNSETILIGGRISRNAKISTGGEVISVLHDIRPDLCLIGTNSIDARIGVTDSDWEVVDVKRAMIKASEKVAVLAISEKLDNAQKIRIAPIDEVDYLITELDPGHALLGPYKAAGIQVI
ncbi:MAG: DeoR/GlpR transcriptional regulator [Phaeodactylibacter sp.]|nr:DeoR/GlpR transcriptional regulator [Phaeodactylibacter sp.]MCB9292956.1 DeoR/GlpR transcriptional regulator [Lewinellaceae bacterium]